MQIYPKVWISILNYNDGRETLRNCLESVFDVDYPNFSVIVTDNGSSDGSLEVAEKEFPKVIFQRNGKNLGFAGGNNPGIKKALSMGADYVLLLNNDVSVEKDFLSKLVEEGEKNREIGILCPLIYQGNKKDIWFSGGKIDWLRMKSNHERKNISENNYKSDFISGCAMLIKSVVFEKIGLFNERFFLYWEDVDFSYRAKKVGFETVIMPSSIIYHFEQSNSQSVKKVYNLVLSGLIFFKKHSFGFLRVWLMLYVDLRKIKNWLDRKLGKNNQDISEAVRMAYKDFKNVKF